MIIGRILFGIGLGLQVVTVPTWQSKCRKSKTRGRWVMIEICLQRPPVALVVGELENFPSSPEAESMVDAGCQPAHS